MVDKKAIATAPNKPTEYKALTAAEKREKQEREAAWAADAPNREWQERIRKTDKQIPRYVEDIIDALPANVRASIATETLDKYNEKKQIRSEKPQ